MKEVIEQLRKFNKERDWEQFHSGRLTPKILNFR